MSKLIDICLATIDPDSPALAERWGLGLELDEFCTAVNMDDPELFAPLDEKVLSYGTLPRIFHAPFSELFPCAIDPKVRRIAKERLEQSFTLAQSYGLNRMVCHGNFIPNSYFPQWFVEQSIGFWKDFMSGKPADCCVYLENVLEPEPELLRDIVQGVDDPRFRLCLDVGHANMGYVSELPISRWLDVCTPLLGLIHLHNNDRSWDWHRPLGDGTLDMEEIISRILNDAPFLSVTLEHTNDSELSLRWLAERGWI